MLVLMIGSGELAVPVMSATSVVVAIVSQE
jgi:hypothetical protein